MPKQIWTSISLKPETKKRMRGKMEKKESYDKFLNRTMDKDEKK